MLFLLFVQSYEKMYNHNLPRYLIVLDPKGKRNDLESKIAGLQVGARLHLLSIIQDIDSFGLNKIMINCKEIKELLQQRGFLCTSEVVKITKGTDNIDSIMNEYAEKMQATLI